MKDTIAVGDRILAQWTGEGREIEGIVKHIPQDTGDMWIIVLKSGAITHINPNCSSLETINKIGEPVDDKETGKENCISCGGFGVRGVMNTKCEVCQGAPSRAVFYG